MEIENAITGDVTTEKILKHLTYESLRLHAEYLHDETGVSSKMVGSVMEACFESFSGDEASDFAKSLESEGVQCHPTDYVLDACFDACGVREDEQNSRLVSHGRAYARITAAVYNTIGIRQPKSDKDEDWGGNIPEGE